MDPDWTRLTRLAEAEMRALRHSLPAGLRDRFDGITVFMEELPPAFMLEEGLTEDTMGVFEGPAFADEGGIELPARMTLFLLNIWDEAGEDERTFRKEVRITLLHELGHFLGLNERELMDRDLD